MPYKRKSILAGTLILTAASVFTRVLGFVYRIYMSKALGAEGMGLYQLIIPVYGLCWSVTCSGITTTVSKLVAAENIRKEYGNMGRVLKQSLVLTCSLALIVAAALFFFAEPISVYFLRDARTALSLRLIALSVPFMAAGSCIRGYFFGLQESLKPAVSQVLEQCVRMAVVFLLAGAFIPRGLEFACAAAVAGMAAGEILSFVYILFSYRRFKSRRGLIKKPTKRGGETLALIISMSLPLTLNRVSGSLLGTLESLLIPQKLEQFGMTKVAAVSLFGRINGMAMPLIYFPSALLTSLSVALVPAVSEAAARGGNARISATVSKSMMFASIIGAFACMVFLVMPGELGEIIYNQDIGGLLFMLGTLCPVLYINMTLSGILNGLGQQLFIFKNSVLSYIITIGGVYFLVPVYGAPAFIAGWFASLLLAAILSVTKIKKITGIKLRPVKWFVKPAISALAVGLTIKHIKTLVPAMGSLPGLFVTLAALGLAYFGLMLALGGIKFSEIRQLYARFVPGPADKELG